MVRCANNRSAWAELWVPPKIMNIFFCLWLARCDGVRIWWRYTITSIWWNHSPFDTGVYSVIFGHSVETTPAPPTAAQHKAYTAHRTRRMLLTKFGKWNAFCANYGFLGINICEMETSDAPLSRFASNGDPLAFGWIAIIHGNMQKW